MPNVKGGFSIVWLRKTFKNCVSLLVTKNRSQKLIKPFVPEQQSPPVFVPACICICTRICLYCVLHLCTCGIVAYDQNTLCLKERSSQKRNTQNSNFKEENSSRFYSWGLQRAVVKKKRLFDSILPPSSSWRWRRRRYSWLVDTFISG